MTGRFLAMVGVLIRRRTDGRFLLLQRSQAKDFAAGEWECVTGRLEQGEGFDDAVIREAQEELGVQPEVEHIIGTAHFYRGPAEPEYEMVGVHYLASLADGAGIALSEEHSDLRWLNLDEARDFLPPGHRLIELMEQAQKLQVH